MNTKLTLLTLTTLALTACGPGSKVGGGKQGAAAAASALSTPTKQAADRSATPADLTDLTYSCTKGGTAKMSNFKAAIDTSGGTSVSQTYTMVLTGCVLASSDAGDALYTGTVEVTQRVITGTGGVQVEQKFKGHVSIDGAFSDFLDTDFAQTVDVSALGKQGDVSVMLKGTVTNTSGTYTYNESVSITAGKIEVSK